MEKFRLWHGDEPEYLEIGSISKAIVVIKKESHLFPEDKSGLQKYENGEWDEWLDEEDQNIHEHIFMFGNTSAFINVDLEDLEDDLEEEDEEEIFEDSEERFINAIVSSGDSEEDEEE